jgi:uncharacterized protein
MKTILLLLLKTYQIIVSPLLHQLLGQKSMCRYEISCSEFAKDAIKKNGALKGSALALKRVLSCQPFTNTYGTGNFS